MMLAQNFTEIDLNNRRAPCANILSKVSSEALLLITDQARFHINASVSKHIFFFWAESNPHKLNQRPLGYARIIIGVQMATLMGLARTFLKRMVQQ